MMIYNFMKTLHTNWESRTTQTLPHALSSHHSRCTFLFLLLSSRTYLLYLLPCISSSELIRLDCNCLCLLQAAVFLRLFHDLRSSDGKGEPDQSPDFHKIPRLVATYPLLAPRSLLTHDAAILPHHLPRCKH